VIPRIQSWEEKLPSGQDKAERYGWEISDLKGEFLWITKNDIHVNEEYQRDTIYSKVCAITAKWSWIGCGVLIVARRNNKYWVVDGQHRLKGASRRSDITALPCMAFDLDSVSDEARAFYTINCLRKAITSMDKLKAETVSGDPIAMFLTNLFASSGVEVKKNANCGGQIKCIGVCRSRATEDQEAFKIVFGLAADICKIDNLPVGEKIIDGLWYLHFNCGEGLRDKHLVGRIREKGARDLMEAAQRQAAHYARGGAKVWASGMLVLLNKSLQRKFMINGNSDGILTSI
jgi:hypothetical protein